MVHKKLTLETMELVRHEFEKTFDDHSYTIRVRERLRYIYEIDNSHLVCLEFQEENPDKPNFTGIARIIELTYNKIGWKFWAKGFRDAIKNLTGFKVSVYFEKFYGFTRYLNWEKPKVQKLINLDQAYPELKIRQRYETATGRLYHFVVFELVNQKGTAIHIVGATDKKIKYLIDKVAERYIQEQIFYTHTKGIKKGHFDEMESALEKYFTQFSAKYEDPEECRQHCLEKHLKYFCIDHCCKEPKEVKNYAANLVKQADYGELDSCERKSYVYSGKKWNREEAVYKLTKKLYKNYGVEFQYYPDFLISSENGYMNYDVFIHDLNIAIEYQGIQHFEPRDYFGGEETFEKRKRLDEEKAKLSKEHNIKLVYVNYWEDLTPSLIISRIGVWPER